MKKLALIIMIFLFSMPAFPVQLVDEAQAVKDMLPGGSRAKTVTVTPEQMKAINTRLGTEVYTDTSKSRDYRVYSGKEGNAVIEHQDGKWGDIEMIVLVDPSGKVVNLAVIASSEKRGRPIVMRTFLKQFVGKALKDNIEVGKGIDSVTGATISSKAVAVMVKRAIAVSELAGGAPAKPADEREKPKTKKK